MNNFVNDLYSHKKKTKNKFSMFFLKRKVFLIVWILDKLA